VPAPRNEWAKQVGERIRAFRVGPDPKHPARTLQECADAAGVTAATWSRWEHGQMIPRFEHEQAIARALGVPQSVLFSRPTGNPR